MSLRAQPLDVPLAIRVAGRELLSLALIDSRNHLLALLGQHEDAAALRLAAQAGWYQEYWLARHVQRQRGEACDPAGPRLAGIEPLIDDWRHGHGEPPDAAELRAYLAESLEVTLDLLAATAEEDAALHFYRLSLWHEDRLGEALVEQRRLGAPPQRADRDPIWLPSQRWLLGSPRADGLVPYAERWAHEVQVPEFEIDAQPVNWARYVEFADDGGYDRAELWSSAGWAWAQAGGRRAPRHVEQIAGGVLVQRGGSADRAQRDRDPAAQREASPGARLVRAHHAQPVMHVSRFEAEAWCRWAGRRLPTEPEWELAAVRASGQGFAWGDVYEWVAGSARKWPGAGPLPPGSFEPRPDGAALAVLRGASFATRSRWRHPKSRRFAPPQHDAAFCGFRSCAI